MRLIGSLVSYPPEKMEVNFSQIHQGGRQAGLDPKAFPDLSQLLPSLGPGTPQGVASQCFHQVSSDVCFYLGVRGSPTANFS